MLQGIWPDLSKLGVVDYLGKIGIFPALGLWLLTFGLGEEVGWRGYALPKLQSSRTALASSNLLGVLWALWHLPAFFYKDTYTSMGIFGFPVFLISVIMASMFNTWLYNSTRGSLLMIIIFHALFDFILVSSAGSDLTPALMTVGVIFLAVRAVKVYGPINLSPYARQVW